MSYKENAFPIGQGSIEITTGTRTSPACNKVYWCRANGTLTLTFADATTDTVDLFAGDAVNLNEPNIESVAITSGTFNIG